MSTTYQNVIHGGMQPLSGAVASSTGQFLNVNPQTYTDTTTAASGTATGTYSSGYVGQPTLIAKNTSVTTQNPATFTIAGPPIAGTNQTITNPLALSVLSGVSKFVSVIATGPTTLGAVTATQLSLPPSFISWQWTSSGQIVSADQQVQVNASNFTITGQSPDNLLASIYTGNLITFPVTGTYTINWYAKMGNPITTSQVEFWIVTKSTTNSFGPAGYQPAHSGGYIFSAQLSFTARFVAGETIALVGQSQQDNNLVGQSGDHTLSILLSTRG